MKRHKKDYIIEGMVRVWAHVGGALWARVGGALGAYVGGAVWTRVGGALWARVGGALGTCCRGIPSHLPSPDSDFNSQRKEAW